VQSVDLPRLRDLLGRLGDAVRQLRELAAATEAEFLADYRNPASAKYLLIVATESAIDICNHLVARCGGGAPDSYVNCFVRLADLGAIDGHLAGRLGRMARFRNLLVHLYWQVDDRRVYQIIREDLGDLEVYRAQVTHWVGADVKP
jgi:uncharacterized protein YutE (UPF0331/DUF86 family)